MLSGNLDFDRATEDDDAGQLAFADVLAKKIKDVSRNPSNHVSPTKLILKIFPTEETEQRGNETTPTNQTNSRIYNFTRRSWVRS